MGPSPSSVLGASMTAATRPRFVMTIGTGVLSSPSRAAASEKVSSSNVKCSEIFMGLYFSAGFRGSLQTHQRADSVDLYPAKPFPWDSLSSREALDSLQRRKHCRRSCCLPTTQHQKQCHLRAR